MGIENNARKNTRRKECGGYDWSIQMKIRRRNTVEKTKTQLLWKANRKGKQRRGGMECERNQKKYDRQLQ